MRWLLQAPGRKTLRPNVQKRMVWYREPANTSDALDRMLGRKGRV